jgi:hypothetical protein
MCLAAPIQIAPPIILPKLTNLADTSDEITEREEELSRYSRFYFYYYCF